MADAEKVQAGQAGTDKAEAAKKVAPVFRMPPRQPKAPLPASVVDAVAAVAGSGLPAELPAEPPATPQSQAPSATRISQAQQNASATRPALKTANLRLTPEQHARVKQVYKFSDYDSMQQMCEDLLMKGVEDLAAQLASRASPLNLK